MKCFGSPTPKRTKCFSNSWAIELLHTTSQKRTVLTAEVPTTRRYISKSGKRGFSGTKHLKETQFLRL